MTTDTCSDANPEMGRSAVDVIEIRVSVVKVTPRSCCRLLCAFQESPLYASPDASAWSTIETLKIVVLEGLTLPQGQTKECEVSGDGHPIEPGIGRVCPWTTSADLIRTPTASCRIHS